MRKTLFFAACLSLLAGPALAQGGQPYNDSNQQAGGAAGGMARRMGLPTHQNPNMAMPPRGSEGVAAATPGTRKVTRKRSKKMKMKTGRMRGHAM